MSKVTKEQADDYLDRLSLHNGDEEAESGLRRYIEQSQLEELRDMIAARALQGILSEGTHDCTPEAIAHDAYLYADAMLTAAKEES